MKDIWSSKLIRVRLNSQIYFLLVFVEGNGKCIKICNVLRIGVNPVAYIRDHSDVCAYISLSVYSHQMII